MKSILEPILAVSVGALLVFVRRSFAKNTIAFQNKVWKMHYGDREIKASEFVILVVGILLIAVGLFNIIR